MIEFLDLFIDCFFYPLTPEINALDRNPFTVVIVCILLGIGFVGMIRRLLWSMC